MSNGNKKNLGQTLYFSQFGGERSIPDVFVAAMERAEERTSGYTADAEIPQEVKNDPNVVDAYFDTREQRTNEKVLVVVRKKDGNITLRDFRTTDQGQTVQVDSTLFYTIDSTFVRAYPSATQDVAIKDLGNRWSIQEVAVSGTWTTDDPPVFVPGIYQGVELSTRREDPIPSSIRSGLLVEEVQSIVTGTVAQPTLGDNDLEARERQVGEGKKLLSRSSRDTISLPVLERTGKELTDLLPPRFRGLIPTSRTTTVTEGSVATPTLGTGELVRTEEQVSALVKLVEVISRAGVTFPVVVVDNATITEYGGGQVTITSSIAVNATYSLDEGEGIVSSKITKLGEGHELKETVARVAGAWPIRYGVEVDENYGATQPITSQVVANNTISGGISDDVVTEARPVDAYRQEKITRSIGSLDSVFLSFPTTVNLDLPPVLVSLQGYIEKNEGSGSYTETGSAGWVGHGSWSSSLRGSGSSSAAILPDLGVEIESTWGNNISAMRYLFFLANNCSESGVRTHLTSVLGTTVNAWPRFRPKPLTFLCIGKRTTLRVDANNSSSNAGDGTGASGSATAGTGDNREVGISIKVVRVPPTLHAALSVGAPTSDTASLSAHAEINIGYLYPNITRTGSVTGSITPTSISATTISAIPTTGLYLLNVRAEPYKFGKTQRIMIDATVIDFSLVG